MKKDFSKFVPVFTVENWDEFETLFRGCGPVVFRGQSDSSWELTTNYERKFKTNVGRESSMIKRCISEGHLYVQNPPAMDDYVSWLAEMQHYGASTRLLDVSRSKYSAMFFAVKENKDKDGAIWAFDAIRSDKALYDMLKPYLSVVEMERDWIGEAADGILPYQDTGCKIANAAIGCEPAQTITKIDKSLNKCRGVLNKLYKKGLIVHVVPDRINRRMLAQQGEFLFPFNISLTFVQNLLGAVKGNKYEGELIGFGDSKIRKKAMGTTTPNVIKVVIPSSFKEEFMDHLLDMNISYQTLFPDEEGFMKSLQYQKMRSRNLITSRWESGKLILSVNEFDL
jgi:hypothetical protein